MTLKPTPEIEKFAKQSLPILKKYGFLKTNYLPLAIIISGILISVVLFYGFYTDSFRTDLNTTVENNQNFPINNQYDFTPSLENNYNFTPQNNYTIINKIYLNCTE